MSVIDHYYTAASHADGNAFRKRQRQRIKRAAEKPQLKIKVKKAAK